MSNGKQPKEMIVMPVDRFKEMLGKVILEAADKAQETGYLAAKAEEERKARQGFNPIKLTERRLWAYPTIKIKLDDDYARLEELKAYGPKRRSADMIRYMKGGTTVDPGDVEEAVMQNLKAEIAADEWEIRMIDTALSMVETDPYFLTIQRKFWEKVSDGDVAKELNCGKDKIWRERTRLISQLSVRLYGAQASNNVIKFGPLPGGQNNNNNKNI